MVASMTIGIHSEIGDLEGVIVHTPGPEVENMTPESAKRALYSDVLNLAVVEEEYAQLEAGLGRFTRVFQIKDLLREILCHDQVRADLIDTICTREKAGDTLHRLMSVSPRELARLLIEGVVMEKDNLTKYLDRERYALLPLHNFFFMRDASAVIFDKVMVSNMANRVRERESLIMAAVFDNHPMFDTPLFHIRRQERGEPPVTIEGGDILVAREDILIIGQGARTSTRGIDGMVEHLKARNGLWHIVVQELPYKPESFIHLDMAFTLLDVDACLVYKPLIMDSNRFLTIHIRIDHGKVTIREVRDIPAVLAKLGMPLKTIFCGGNKDTYTQDREQWHSGANFFCVAPGKIIGYGRNVFTLEELARHGFEIVPAQALADETFDPRSRQKIAVTIEGTELARGGGGCRCMTMPLKRKKITWK